MKRLIFLAILVLVGGFLVLSPLGYSRAADAEQPKLLSRLTSSKPFDLQWNRAPIREQSTRFSSQILEQNNPEWIRVFKGDKARMYPRYISFITQTSTGRFLIGGENTITKYFPEVDVIVFLLEINSEGRITQQKGFTGYEVMSLGGFNQTHDGKYVLTGQVRASVATLEMELFLLKVSSQNYAIETQTLLEHVGDNWSSEVGLCVQQTSDGKYLVAGRTNFLDPYRDIWLLKCSQNFNIEFQQAYGGDSFESGPGYKEPSIIELSDGRYLLVTNTESYGAGIGDIWILEFDQNLNLTSQQTIGGTEDDYVGRGPCVLETSDKRIIVAGTTESYGAGIGDIWILEFDQNLNLISQKAIGRLIDEKAQCIQPTDDGGFIIAGGTTSNYQHVDAYYLKLSPTLEVEWEYSFGKEGREEAEYAIQTDDGRYVITGSIQLNPPTLDYDFFALMVSENGNVLPESTWIKPVSSQVTNTSVLPSQTYTIPKSTAGIKEDSDIIPTPTNFTTESLYWNLNRPPINLSLERTENKSFLVSDIWHILRWDPDPYNSQFTIASYKIYRREVVDEFREDPKPYQEIGTVPGNSYEFADSDVQEDKKYEYVITSVASDGTESPPSEPIGN